MSICSPNTSESLRMFELSIIQLFWDFLKISLSNPVSDGLLPVRRMDETYEDFVQNHIYSHRK